MQIVAFLVLTACSLGALQQGLAYDNAFAIWSSGFTAAGALHTLVQMIKSIRGNNRRERS